MSLRILFGVLIVTLYIVLNYQLGDKQDKDETKLADTHANSQSKGRLIQAHELMKKEHDRDAVLEAKVLLLAIQKECPEWNPALVRNRIEKCDRLLGAMKPEKTDGGGEESAGEGIR